MPADIARYRRKGPGFSAPSIIAGGYRAPRPGVTLARRPSLSFLHCPPYIYRYFAAIAVYNA